MNSRHTPTAERQDQLERNQKRTHPYRSYSAVIIEALDITKKRAIQVALSSLTLIACTDGTTSDESSSADAQIAPYDSNVAYNINLADSAIQKEDRVRIDMSHENIREINNPEDAPKTPETEVTKVADIVETDDTAETIDMQNDISETQNDTTDNEMDISKDSAAEALSDIATDTCVNPDPKDINGNSAINVIGQVNIATGIPILDSGKINNGEGSTNARGFNEITDVAIDTVHHRAFFSDRWNHRVLGHNLNSSDQFTDYEADFVFGQPDFISNKAATTQNGMNAPFALAYDSVNNRLFVVEMVNCRVTVYDTKSTKNGQNAMYVLGQPDFTSNIGYTTQNGMNSPSGATYDVINNRLIVSDSWNNRLLIFDGTTIANGKNAMHVLGQMDFTSSSSGATQGKLHSPSGLAYIPEKNYIITADTYNNRLIGHDGTSITDGQNALFVIGQMDFTSNAGSATQNGLYGPKGLAHDSGNNDLYIADSGNHRILKMSMKLIMNGQNAASVLGQPDFTSNKAATKKNGLYNPWGLSYNSMNGDLIIADHSNHRGVIHNGKQKSCKTNN